MLNIKKDTSKGFTLLEILLVVGIISILAGIVIVAINPSKQLASVRNAERKSDIKQIDSAITQYYIDNFHFPTSLSGASSLKEICDTGSLASSSITADCTGLVDLSVLVPDYITAIPRDPSATTTDHAGYQVILSSNKIGLSAPAELGATITIGIATGTGGGGGESLGISGLVAHYLMNGTNGTTVIDTVGGNTATGAYTVVSGNIEGAGGFEHGPATGYAGSLTAPQGLVSASTFDISGSEARTLTAWLFRESNDQGQQVVYLSQPDNYYFGIGIGWFNYMLTGYGPADLDTGYDATSDLNTWVHLSVTYDGTYAKFYRNGEQIGNTKTYTYNTPAGYLAIGKLLGSYGDWPVTGKIDDVRVYDRALTEEEIGQIYNGGDGTEAE